MPNPSNTSGSTITVTAYNTPRVLGTVFNTVSYDPVRYGGRRSNEWYACTDYVTMPVGIGLRIGDYTLSGAAVSGDMRFDISSGAKVEFKTPGQFTKRFNNWLTCKVSVTTTDISDGVLTIPGRTFTYNFNVFSIGRGLPFFSGDHVFFYRVGDYVSLGLSPEAYTHKPPTRIDLNFGGDLEDTGQNGVWNLTKHWNDTVTKYSGLTVAHRHTAADAQDDDIQFAQIYGYAKTPGIYSVSLHARSEQMWADRVGITIPGGTDVETFLIIILPYGPQPGELYAVLPHITTSATEPAYRFAAISAYDQNSAISDNFAGVLAKAARPSDFNYTFNANFWDPDDSAVDTTGYQPGYWFLDAIESQESHPVKVVLVRNSDGKWLSYYKVYGMDHWKWAGIADPLPAGVNYPPFYVPAASGGTVDKLSLFAKGDQRYFVDNHGVFSTVGTDAQGAAVFAQEPVYLNWPNPGATVNPVTTHNAVLKLVSGGCNGPIAGGSAIATYSSGAVNVAETVYWDVNTSQFPPFTNQQLPVYLSAFAATAIRGSEDCFVSLTVTGENSLSSSVVSSGAADLFLGRDYSESENPYKWSISAAVSRGSWLLFSGGAVSGALLPDSQVHQTSPVAMLYAPPRPMQDHGGLLSRDIVFRATPDDFTFSTAPSDVRDNAPVISISNFEHVSQLWRYGNYAGGEKNSDSLGTSEGRWVLTAGYAQYTETTYKVEVTDESVDDETPQLRRTIKELSQTGTYMYFVPDTGSGAWVGDSPDLRVLSSYVSGGLTTLVVSAGGSTFTNSGALVAYIRDDFDSPAISDNDIAGGAYDNQTWKVRQLTATLHAAYTGGDTDVGKLTWNLPICTDQPVAGAAASYIAGYPWANYYPLARFINYTVDPVLIKVGGAYSSKKQEGASSYQCFISGAEIPKDANKYWSKSGNEFVVVNYSYSSSTTDALYSSAQSCGWHPQTPVSGAFAAWTGNFGTYKVGGWCPNLPTGAGSVSIESSIKRDSEEIHTAAKIIPATAYLMAYRVDRYTTRKVIAGNIANWIPGGGVDQYKTFTLIRSDWWECKRETPYEEFHCSGGWTDQEVELSNPTPVSGGCTEYAIKDASLTYGSGGNYNADYTVTDTGYLRGDPCQIETEPIDSSITCATDSDQSCDGRITVQFNCKGEMRITINDPTGGRICNGTTCEWAPPPSIDYCDDDVPVIMESRVVRVVATSRLSGRTTYLATYTTSGGWTWSPKKPAGAAEPEVSVDTAGNVTIALSGGATTTEYLKATLKYDKPCTDDDWHTRDAAATESYEVTATALCTASGGGYETKQTAKTIHLRGTHETDPFVGQYTADIAEDGFVTMEIPGASYTGCVPVINGTIRRQIAAQIRREHTNQQGIDLMPPLGEWKLSCGGTYATPKITGKPLASKLIAFDTETARCPQYNAVVAWAATNSYLHDSTVAKEQATTPLFQVKSGSSDNESWMTANVVIGDGPDFDSELSQPRRALFVTAAGAGHAYVTDTARLNVTYTSHYAAGTSGADLVEIKSGGKISEYILQTTSADSTPPDVTWNEDRNVPLAAGLDYACGGGLQRIGGGDIYFTGKDVNANDFYFGTVAVKSDGTTNAVQGSDYSSTSSATNNGIGVFRGQHYSSGVSYSYVGESERSYGAAKAAVTAIEKPAAGSNVSYDYTWVSSSLDADAVINIGFRWIEYASGGVVQ